MLLALSTIVAEFGAHKAAVVRNERAAAVGSNR
jgi:hypothetical protein